MNTAVVELDPLTDTVRAAAKHHDLLFVGRLGFTFLVVAGIHVRSIGRELGSTGIDALVKPGARPVGDGTDARQFRPNQAA